jgi:hypothetical protein
MLRVKLFADDGVSVLYSHDGQPVTGFLLLCAFAFHPDNPDFYRGQALCTGNADGVLFQRNYL